MIVATRDREPGRYTLAWGALLYSALISIVVGNVFWFTAIDRVGPGRASLQAPLARACDPPSPDNLPVATLEAVLEELLETTGASRATVRRNIDRPSPFPVVAEALAPGAASLGDERSVDLPTQPVVLEIQKGNQVVQDDCANAYDDPAFQAMLVAYGGLAAQIVTPIRIGGRLEAILSLHQLGEPRHWTGAEIAAASAAADELRGLL